jgi:opacity protein-like surface antigen
MAARKKNYLLVIYSIMGLLINFFATTNVFASPPQTTQALDHTSNFSGYYIEAGATMNWYGLQHSSMAVAQNDGWPADTDIVANIDHTTSFSLGTGYLWTFDRSWFSNNSVGLEYSYGLPTSIKGNVEQFSLPQFINYNYRYRMYRNTLLIVGKTDIASWHHFMPYVETGLGASWNTSGNYNEQAEPGVTPRVNPGFSDSASNSTFAYAVGVGLDYAIKNNLWLSVGYRYSGFGNINTGAGTNTFSGNNLNNTIYSNSVFARIRYAFL